MIHFPHITFAAKSDIGLRRTNNEDNFGVFPEVGVFCVADGMGGGDDGEVASDATVRAVEMFAAAYPLPKNAAYPIQDFISRLEASLNRASAWILKRAKEKHLHGCGSTIVGFCLDPSNPQEAVAFHAGDSRLYRIRGRSIQQITKDHSAAELMGAKSEKELNPMFRGMILRAVGIQDKVEAEQTRFDVKEGDRLLLCSDGLSRMVSDRRISSIVRESSTLDNGVESLIKAANDAGGVDNITAILVNVGKMPSPLPVKAMPFVKEKRDGEPSRNDSSAEASTRETEPNDSTTSISSGTDELIMPPKTEKPEIAHSIKRRNSDSAGDDRPSVLCSSHKKIWVTAACIIALIGVLPVLLSDDQVDIVNECGPVLKTDVSSDSTSDNDVSGGSLNVENCDKEGNPDANVPPQEPNEASPEGPASRVNATHENTSEANESEGDAFEVNKASEGNSEHMQDAVDEGQEETDAGEDVSISGGSVDLDRLEALEEESKDNPAESEASQEDVSDNIDELSSLGPEVLVEEVNSVSEISNVQTHIAVAASEDGRSDDSDEVKEPIVVVETAETEVSTPNAASASMEGSADDSAPEACGHDDSPDEEDKSEVPVDCAIVRPGLESDVYLQIDGVDAASIERVFPGNHTLIYSRKGYVSQSFDVVARAGEDCLLPEPAIWMPERVDVFLPSLDGGIRCFLDKLEVSGVQRLYPGRYVCTYSKLDYEKQTFDFYVEVAKPCVMPCPLEWHPDRSLSNLQYAHKALVEGEWAEALRFLNEADVKDPVNIERKKVIRGKCEELEKEYRETQKRIDESLEVLWRTCNDNAMSFSNSLCKVYGNLKGAPRVPDGFFISYSSFISSTSVADRRERGEEFVKDLISVLKSIETYVEMTRMDINEELKIPSKRNDAVIGLWLKKRHEALNRFKSRFDRLKVNVDSAEAAFYLSALLVADVPQMFLLDPVSAAEQ